MENGITNVQEMSLSLQRFGIADYVVFVMMLSICAVIGIYFGFFSGKVSAEDYLMGGRSMKTFPIAMSLISSFISGITLLGTPTEMYLYGIQYMYIGFSVILMSAVMSVAYLPVLHNLRLTSAYEYLEMRFSKRARLFGSFLFAIGIMTWIPIVIYVPALAFNQVTGINVHIITPVVCLVCIFYTCVGGLKAVVWTDVIQTFMMFGSMVLVIIKGTIDIGGPSVVWERNYESGRIEAPNLDINLLERHTLLVLTLGGFCHWMFNSGLSQIMMQRYLSLNTLREARGALCIFVVGVLTLIGICCYSGLLIFAAYHDCDPLTTKLAQAKDQLLPLFVMRTLGHLPGLPGCFVAGVFSAALSSMSTAMNSMSAVVLEDFLKAFRSKPLTERQTNIIMRSVVVITGFVCVALVFVVEKLGSVLQMSMSLGAITNGPCLGIFSMGLFLPWVNAKGMVIGGAAGLGFMSWIILGAQAAIASGNMKFATMPLSVEGCTYNFTSVMLNSTTMASDIPTESDVFPLFRLSYLWYTLVGCLVSMVVSIPASFCTGATDPATVDHRLLSPVILRFMPAQKTVVTDTKDTIYGNGYKAVELHIIPKNINSDRKKSLES